MSTISINEIFANSQVEFAMIRGVQYIAVHDIIMHFGGQTAKTANKTWERLDEAKKAELEACCTQFQFPGVGRKSEAVITFKGALTLIMLIGGANAKRYRSMMANVLTRYYAGSDSLIEEMQANAKSAAPIAQMARASLLADAASIAQLAGGSLLSDAAPIAQLAGASLLADAAPIPKESNLQHKRKLEELELAKLEFELDVQKFELDAKKVELDAKKVELDARKLENKARKMTSLENCSSGYLDLCNTNMDPRGMQVFKELFLNMAAQDGNPGPANSKGAM